MQYVMLQPVGFPMLNLPSVNLIDAEGKGLGLLDFFTEDAAPHTINEEVLEKWWCIGDSRNRTGMWVQGRKVM